MLRFHAFPKVRPRVNSSAFTGHNRPFTVRASQGRRAHSEFRKMTEVRQNGAPNEDGSYPSGGGWPQLDDDLGVLRPVVLAEIISSSLHQGRLIFVLSSIPFGRVLHVELVISPANILNTSRREHTDKEQCRQVLVLQSRPGTLHCIVGHSGQPDPQWPASSAIPLHPYVNTHHSLEEGVPGSVRRCDCGTGAKPCAGRGKVEDLSPLKWTRRACKAGDTTHGTGINRYLIASASLSKLHNSRRFGCPGPSTSRDRPGNRPTPMSPLYPC